MAVEEMNQMARNDSLGASQPIFLPAIILERDLISMKTAIKQLKVAIKTKVSSTIEQLKGVLENETNWNLSSSSLASLELTRNYQAILTDSIAELESVESKIARLVNHS
ncbi:hypothetical protein V2K56_01730 [Pseudomonas alliivorans]|nr:hypothetical protein [Pseudomonas alliivorans]